MTLKKIFGYIWAALCLLTVPVLFFGFNAWPDLLVKASGLHVSPRFSGGEVVRSITFPGYETRIHRPVFDGLLSERSEGFVQIDWVPASKLKLPPRLEGELDLDGDGSADAGFVLDTLTDKVSLSPHHSWVGGVETLVNVDGERILRIRLHNPRKSG